MATDLPPALREALDALTKAAVSVGFYNESRSDAMPALFAARAEVERLVRAAVGEAERRGRRQATSPEGVPFGSVEVDFQTGEITIIPPEGLVAQPARGEGEGA